MLATGFDGQMTTASAVRQGLDHARGGPGGLRPPVAHPLHLVPSPAGHPVLLEVEVEPLPLGGDLHAGRHGVVGHGDQSARDAEGVAEGGGRLRERCPSAEEVAPEEVGGEVEVTEREPGLPTQAAQLLQDAEGLIGAAPAPLSVRQVGEPVRDRVEIGGDVQAVEGEVVSGVDHDREVVAGDDPDQPPQELPGPDASGQCHDAHGVSLRRFCVWRPTRSL